VNADGYISKPGFYELITVDHNNCELSSFIEVIEIEPVSVSLANDFMNCAREFILQAHNTQNNPEETVYTWSSGESGEFLTQISIENHDINIDHEYWVQADFEGCTASDTILILTCRYKDLPPIRTDAIPNTFTPNGDGDNDVWNIFELEKYPDCTIEVYDRWQRKVFVSAKGYPVPWDGKDTNGRLLPLETYYYVIELNDGVTRRPITGTVTIIR
jgi:gliding motility-associated-like protein